MKIFFAFVFVLITPASLSWGSVAENSKPNVILIYVDDLGYGDLGCYGGTDIETPNIDRLAKDGMRFTDAHVTCSVCGPSRVGLMTGRYQQEFGCYWNRDLWHQMGWELPASVKVLPQSLKAAGYATGLVGKWNVSLFADGYFDEVNDVMLWKGAYYPDKSGFYSGVNSGDFRPEKHGWGSQENGEYLTDRLTRKAIRFIERHQDDPFFLYLAYNAPHSPLNADIKYKKKYAHLSPEPYQIYAGMVDSLDQNIGRVMDYLEALGLDENTLIIFASDNGPAKGSKYLVEWPEHFGECLLGSTGGLNGKKASRYEGGHRVPFIVKWPGVVACQQVSADLVSTLDIYPTLLKAVHVTDPSLELDGEDLFPVLKGETEMRRTEPMFWMTHQEAAVREGEWKLLLRSNGSAELFNLAEDVGERNDLFQSQKNIGRRLFLKLVEWSADLPEPVCDYDKLDFNQYAF